MIAIDKNSWAKAGKHLRVPAPSPLLTRRLSNKWCDTMTAETKVSGCDHERRSFPAPVHAGSRCAKGSYRETNEDRSYTDVRRGIFLVVDGVGGYAGGTEASKVLLEHVPRALERCHEQEITDLNQIRHALEDSLATARLAMMEIARRKPAFQKMGATLAAGFVLHGTLYVAHVGDCRAYLARGRSIRQLTSDESLVQGLVDAGVLTPEQARRDPRRNIVLNVVSPCRPNQELTAQQIDLHPGDHLVLATDGLTGSVSDNEIAETIHAHRCSQVTADELVLTALRNGSRDNVSCVVAAIGPVQLPEEQP